MPKLLVTLPCGVPYSLGSALALAVALALPAAADTASAAAPGKLTVEMNKFETAEGTNGEAPGCRAYFLFRNETESSFEAFQMSLAILNKDGVIDRLLAIDAAPLPVARTTLKLFDIPGLACTDISQVLLHDIPACKPQNGEAMDCFPLVTLQSRTSAELVE